MFVNRRPEISPITIVENDNVRRGQIYAKTSSTGGQQKYEFFAVWFIVLVDCNDPVVVCSATVDTAILLGFGATSELV